MKGFKRIGFFLCCALLAASVIGCGASEPAAGAAAGTSAGEKIVFRFAHNASAGQPIDVAGEMVAKTVAEKTNGRFEIQMFGNNLLGTEIPQRDMTSEGSLDMAAIGYGALGGWNTAFCLPMVHFTFKTPEQCVAMWESDFGKKYVLDPLLTERKIRLLDQWKNSDRQLMSKKPVHSLADFKGLKLRIPSGQSSKEQGWDDLGVLGLSLALDEALTGMQQGVCDAVEMPVDFLNGYRFQETAKHLTMTAHRVYTQWILIHEGSWQKLSADDQNILTQAVKDAGVKANEMRIANEDKILKDFANSGVEIYRFTDAQYKELTNTMNQVYEYNKQIAGEEVYNAFMVALEKIRSGT